MEHFTENTIFLMATKLETKVQENSDCNESEKCISQLMNAKTTFKCLYCKRRLCPFLCKTTFFRKRCVFKMKYL